MDRADSTLPAASGLITEVMALRDPAPHGMRLSVSQSATHAWNEPASAHYLGRAFMNSVRFDVPGLRGDGTQRGVHTAQWVLGRMPLQILAVIWLVLTFVLRVLVVGVLIVVDAALSGTAAASYDAPKFRQRRRVKVVAAAPAAGAVSFGHALRRRRGHLWLVTSARNFALTQVSDGEQTVMWQAQPRPTLSVKKAELRWPDSSHVSFAWPRAERRLQSRSPDVQAGSRT